LRVRRPVSALRGGDSLGVQHAVALRWLVTDRRGLAALRGCLKVSAADERSPPRRVNAEGRQRRIGHSPRTARTPFALPRRAFVQVCLARSPKDGEDRSPAMVRSNARFGFATRTNALRRDIAEGVLLGGQVRIPQSPWRAEWRKPMQGCAFVPWPAWGIAFAPAWGIPRRRRPATSPGVLGRAHIERYSRSGALLIRRDSYLRLGTIRANEERPSILRPLRRCSPAAAHFCGQGRLLQPEHGLLHGLADEVTAGRRRTRQRRCSAPR
jgi:hypothetical protein